MQGNQELAIFPEAVLGVVDMKGLLGFILGRAMEIVFTVPSLALYANILFPSNDRMDVIAEIYGALTMIAVFYVFSGYMIISFLISIFAFRNSRFEYILVLGYILSVAIFLLFNPMYALSSIALFLVVGAIVFLCANLSRRLANTILRT